MRNSIINSKKTYIILGILFIFVGWTIASLIVDNNYVIPSVIEMLDALGDLFVQGHTYIVLGYTLVRLFMSVLFCLVLGILFASISYISYRFENFVKPIIVLFKSLPLAVVITLILLMFSDDLAVYYIVSVVVFPIIYEGTLSGLNSISKDIIDEVKLVSKINAEVVYKIHLKMSLPHILTSLIQSLGLGLKVLVMAEYISQPEYSIGNEIIYYKDISIEMNYVYAWSFILISFILVFDLFISKLTKRLSFV